VGPPWAQAFLVATAITLAVTPVLRRLAVAVEFVDRPEAAHKSHLQATPYLGGVGLIVAVLVGLLFTSGLTAPAGLVALGGAVIGCVGLLDDHRSVGPLLRFLVEAAVAGVALAVGLRVYATDIAVIDGLITIVWIVGVTNAVNLLDNMDGLASGVSGAAAAAIFALAVLNEQPVPAAIAAALAGACLGFFVYNKRPASIFMGDAGSLFLGFVLAVLTIEVSPALPQPASFAVPVMLLALPVLDTATVTICRLRRRRSIMQGGKDHLSHKLVARGLSPGLAVGVLVAVESGVGVLAVLAGRDVLPLPVAVLGVAAMLAGVALVTLRAPVYREPVVGFAPRLKQAAACAAAGAALLVAPAVVALIRAHGPGDAGTRLATQGLEALAAGQAAQATELFARAEGKLEQADAALHAPLSSFGLVVPGLRANVATARAFVDAGRQVVGAASGISKVASLGALPVRADGQVAAEMERLAPALSDAAAVLRRSAATLAGYNRPYLWPSLGKGVRTLRTQLDGASARALDAADVARVLPAMLGHHGPRRYFVALQDSRELRGSGGVVHRWGELVAEAGRLSLVHLGRVEELAGRGGAEGSGAADLPQEVIDRYRQFDVAGTWQNANVSPDFSVTGRVITSMYTGSTAGELDGVVSVDLPGLAALLDASGPVVVGGWPTPVDGAGLVETILLGSYARYPDEPGREDFVTRVMEGVVQAFARTDHPSVAGLAHTLGPAVQKGHLRFYSARPEEQDFLQRAGVAGQIPGAVGDSLLVVNQNLSATGVDPYLRRSIDYRMTLEPGARSAALSGRLQVTLRNDASPTPPWAPTGPAAGGNRTYLSMYSPLTLLRASGGVHRVAMESDREFGRYVYSTIVDVPAQQSRTVGIDLMGTVALDEEGWYHLDVLHQPTMHPDEITVSLSVPDGWRIAEARGLRMDDAGSAVATLSLDRHGALAVRVERTAWARLWAVDGG
jgi:UDP-GlcNAc:undecaprenyl-phosphate GlcNAc-1-phosphate transferase